MKKKYIITLSEAERASLKQLMQTGKINEQKNTRVRILLKSDQKGTNQTVPDQVITQALETSVNTVYRARIQFIE